MAGIAYLALVVYMSIWVVLLTWHCWCICLYGWHCLLGTGGVYVYMVGIAYLALGVYMSIWLALLTWH